MDLALHHSGDSDVTVVAFVKVELQPVAPVSTFLLYLMEGEKEENLTLSARGPSLDVRF